MLASGLAPVFALAAKAAVLALKAGLALKGALATITPELPTSGWSTVDGFGLFFDPGRRPRRFMTRSGAGVGACRASGGSCSIARKMRPPDSLAASRPGGDSRVEPAATASGARGENKASAAFIAASYESSLTACGRLALNDFFCGRSSSRGSRTDDAGASLVRRTAPRYSVTNGLTGRRIFISLPYLSRYHIRHTTRRGSLDSQCPGGSHYDIGVERCFLYPNVCKTSEVAVNSHHSTYMRTIECGTDANAGQMRMRDALNSELKLAMKSGEKRRVETIRLINAAIKDRDIEARGQGKTVGDQDLLSLLQKMIKSRQESIEIYEKAARPELAQREAEEVAIIQGFLPQQMSDGDVAAAIDAAIAESGATSIKDMGKVVGALKARHAGRMDFAKASAVVKARLAG